MRRSLLALFLFALALQSGGLAAYHFSQASPDLSFVLLLVWGCLAYLLAHQQMQQARAAESLEVDESQQKLCYRSGDRSETLDWNSLEWFAVGRQSEGRPRERELFSHRLYAHIRSLGVCALGENYETAEQAQAALTRLKQNWDVPVRPDFRRPSELYFCMALVAGVAISSVPLIYLLGL